LISAVFVPCWQLWPLCCAAGGRDDEQRLMLVLKSGLLEKPSYETVSFPQRVYKARKTFYSLGNNVKTHLRHAAWYLLQALMPTIKSKTCRRRALVHTCVVAAKFDMQGV